jgi:hypothetical protein
MIKYTKKWLLNLMGLLFFILLQLYMPLAKLSRRHLPTGGIRYHLPAERQKVISSFPNS